MSVVISISLHACSATGRSSDLLKAEKYYFEIINNDEGKLAGEAYYDLCTLVQEYPDRVLSPNMPRYGLIYAKSLT